MDLGQLAGVASRLSAGADLRAGGDRIALGTRLLLPLLNAGGSAPTELANDLRAAVAGRETVTVILPATAGQAARLEVGSRTFLLPPADILDHLTARQREAEFHLPQGVESLQVDAERVRALFEWGKRLVDSASKHPDLFDEQPKKRIAVRDELLETLLATLRLADDFESTRSDRTRQAQSAIVKAVEDYALAQTGDRLYVTDLCKVAAVSERTLENVFKEVMGLTPMTYLARLRLHRVREALLAAAPGSTTVSVEALNWGFWHFGEFSRAYKQCFGELPSDTLRRKT